MAHADMAQAKDASPAKTGSRAEARRDRARSRELVAVAALALVGVPLVVFLGMSLADGVRRSAESPLRSMIGDGRYEELTDGDGEAGFPHYVGRERLAPDFTLRDRHGNAWTLSDHRGKVVVLNFWSITCPPCLEEMPTLEELAELSARWDDVEVVAVSTDSGWDEVATVLPEDPTLTHLFDPSKEVVQGKFGTELYPETWIIDGDGVVRFRFDGGYDWSSPLVLDVIESFR
ncbi:MAG TPA: TlpA disulfide reductase family protein [Polyangiaceae bacterium LLY-WYZ-15_(1-7)]|nr:hypothetical protein [Sandaracinus sp.]MBJ73024.1 hypothetical protein [Sandaracinus sp.]HJK94129.1 TlpA disulfide reductase family protein [Polyangiaceae bacterium LLY-WYZ-15_(1-7)]HJL10985.1 TlpA disulfide reductase family protein [Polyangiaceae bacterium LLY-WYZ-15_(1-7)]HJL33991.1 TlpA disulfide reductase family protein [Polyangiaceae bacterium LLY-WYZ-15_(1-7)]